MPQALITAPAEQPVRLPCFEGPLDLLLYLIRKNELNIYDIPIETVTRQYLDILAAMEKLDLEVAGEFFVTAATLMYIKSRMLLPQKERLPDDDTADDSLDPRWELVQQLIEYQKFKKTAEALTTLSEERQDYLPRHAIKPQTLQYRHALRPSDTFTLWNTFNQVLRRLAERARVSPLTDEPITVADCMQAILSALKTKSIRYFSQILPIDYTLVHLVAHFLAILELTRVGKISLVQEALFTDIKMVHI